MDEPLTLHLMAVRAADSVWEHLDPIRTDLKSLLSDPQCPYDVVVFSVEKGSAVVWVMRFLRRPNEGSWSVEGMTSSSPVDDRFWDQDDAVVFLQATRR